MTLASYSQKLFGRAACGGVVTGKARIVRSKEESSQIQVGEIMVSETSSPDYVWAITQAKAVVTDLGGITSHAAIVCREIKKPCVVGTGDATKRVANGEWVCVDGNLGVIYFNGNYEGNKEKLITL